MAATTEVTLRGLKEVDDRLVLLGKVAGEKVMRRTLFAAAKPIMDQAKRNIAAIPGGSGALHKATRRVYLKARRSSEGSGTRFTVAVGPKATDATAVALANLHYKRGRRGKPIRRVFWGHFVEWGFTTRNGRKIPGRHVFLRALESGAGLRAMASFKSLIGKAVDRALKKQGIQ